MAEVITHVIVVDEGLYQGTGLVNRWLTGITGALYRSIFIAAPVRSGELRGGLQFHTSRDGLRQVSGIVESTAPHTKYVIGGTAAQGAGYIYTTRGYTEHVLVDRMLGGEFVKDAGPGLWLVLSDARGGRHLRVHGQKANNFMLTGYNKLAARSSALKPIFPGFVT